MQSDNRFTHAKCQPEKPKPKKREMTICAKCRHRDFRGRIWYDLFCRNPLVAPPDGIDWVTGKPANKCLPHCRDINKD